MVISNSISLVKLFTKQSASFCNVRGSLLFNRMDHLPLTHVHVCMSVCVMHRRQLSGNGHPFKYHDTKYIYIYIYILFILYIYIYHIYNAII